MDVDGFWRVVDASRSGLDLTDPEAAVDAQLDAIRAALEPLPASDLLAFQERLHEQSSRANDWRLWAAGYLAAGGMSDDSFDYFRLWLVLQGRTTFEQLLADADALAEQRWDDEGAAFDAAESLGYLVLDVLEERGSDPGDALVTATAGGEPTGTRFREDDDAWFAEHFPRLHARVEDQAERITRYADVESPDVRRFVAETSMADRPIAPSPMEPLLAAELYERGWIRHQDRPMIAAFWLAEDRGGEAVLELASLHGHEPEVSELWPLALEELGVRLPVNRSPVVMAWAARRVLSGERNERWLVRMIWPHQDELDRESDFDQLVFTLDDWLDRTDRDLRSRQTETRARAESARRAVHTAVEAMARDDIAGALSAFADWPDG